VTVVSGSSQSTVARKKKASKDELDVDCVSHGSPIRSHSRPKPQIQQHFAEFGIVSPVRRWIEPEQLRLAFLVHVEKCGEMISLE
jgi:hypothetical protein